MNLCFYGRCPGTAKGKWKCETCRRYFCSEQCRREHEKGACELDQSTVIYQSPDGAFVITEREHIIADQIVNHTPVEAKIFLDDMGVSHREIDIAMRKYGAIARQMERDERLGVKA